MGRPAKVGRPKAKVGRPKAKAKAKAKAKPVPRTRSEAAKAGWERRREAQREAQRLAEIRSKAAKRGHLTRKKKAAERAREEYRRGVGTRKSRRKKVHDYIEAMWEELGGEDQDATISDLYDLYYGYGDAI